MSIRQEDMARVEDKFLSATDYCMGIFRRTCMYMDRYVEPGVLESALRHSPLELVEVDVECYGGRISTTLCKNVTHVVVDEDHLERVALLYGAYSDPSKGMPYVVEKKWVEACIVEGQRLDEGAWRVGV